MTSFFSCLNEQDFFEKYWGKESYLFNANVKLANSTEIINQVLNSDIQYPDFRIIQRGGSINPYLYTDSDISSLSNKINRSKVCALDLTGKTLKISHLDAYDKRLDNLSKDLSHYFLNTDISINGYFSHGLSQGGSPHYDFYHIFALQVEGEKEWKIGNIVEKNPHKDFGHKDITDDEYEKKIITKPGNVLYLPPGIWHDVSSEMYSFHLAIGIQTKRIYQLLNQIVHSFAKKNSLFRTEFPMVYTNKLEYGKLSDDEIDCMLNIIKMHLKESI